jgi:hypothetical protein
MWLFGLYGFYDVDSNQHGFNPRRGTLTAWAQVVKQIVPSRNIYEVDFKGYFPSINATHVSWILVNLGAPPCVGEFFTHMGITPPQRASLDENLLDETNALWKHELADIHQLYGGPLICDPTFTSYSELVDSIRLPNSFKTPPYCLDENGNYIGKVLKDYLANGPENIDKDILITLIGDYGYSSAYIKKNLMKVLYEYYLIETIWKDSHAAARPDVQSAIPLWGQANPALTHRDAFQNLPPTLGFRVHLEETTQGLPQGSCLSPFLSVIAFDHIWTKDILPRYPSIRYLAYADDMIFYSNDDNAFNEFVTALPTIVGVYGLTVADNKSVISKRKNTWLHDRLKFLGVLYTPSTNTISSETRKGARLPWTFENVYNLSMSISGGLRVKLPTGRSVVLSKENADIASTLLLYQELAKDWIKFYYFHRLNLYDLLDAKKVKRLLEATESTLLNAVSYGSDNMTASLRDLFSPTGKLFHDILHNVKSTRATLRPLYDISKTFDGPFAGLLMARIYIGRKILTSFKTPSGSQDFRLNNIQKDVDSNGDKLMNATPNLVIRSQTSPRARFNGSLANVIQSQLPSYVTSFNGTSIASHEVTRLSKHLTDRLRGHKTSPFKLLAGWHDYINPAIGNPSVFENEKRRARTPANPVLPE